MSTLQNRELKQEMGDAIGQDGGQGTFVLWRPSSRSVCESRAVRSPYQDQPRAAYCSVPANFGWDLRLRRTRPKKKHNKLKVEVTGEF